jgi:predicted NBD/HSP70 family sugar kinase
MGAQNLVYLHGDVGVGGGIIVGGTVLDGDVGYGCELGHMVVNPHDGRPCGCGSSGCLEAEAGASRCARRQTGRWRRRWRESWLRQIRPLASE